MTSIIKVDQIQLTDGNAPTAADLGFAAGNVINVKVYEYAGSSVVLASGVGSTLWQTPS